MKTTLENVSRKVRFALEKSYTELEKNPQIESIIMLHFSSNGKRFKKSTGYKCAMQFWDKNKQRLKTSKQRAANAHIINAELNELENFINIKCTELSINGNYSISTIKEKVTHKLRGDENVTPDTLSFIEYDEHFIEEKKSSLAKVSYRAHKQIIKKLESFSEMKNITLSFEDINMSFLTFK